MPRPPKPDLELVNLGAIVDQPFVYQANNPSTVKVPSALSSLTKATALPDGTSEGTTTYTYGPMLELAGEVQVNDGATKTTRYHYSAPDPVELLVALEKKAKEQEKVCAELDLQEAASKQARASARQRLKVTREKIAKVRGQGSVAPARLVATSWIEIGEGSLIVKGETRFEYEGTDIISALTTVTTMEDPPRVDELESTFRYNDLGQVSEIDVAGSVTHCEYDPLGRLAVKRGGFVSPSGDFLAHHRTVFLYSPPVGDPNQVPPPNALLSSTNDSMSGTPTAFEQTPEPLESIPEPPGSPADAEGGGEADNGPGWLGKLFGSSPGDAPSPAGAPEPPSIDPPTLSGDFDYTKVSGTYTYP